MSDERSLARNIFKSGMTNDAIEEDDAGNSMSKGAPSAGAVAGKELARALKAGDGEAIYMAFKTMLEECGSSDDDMAKTGE
jgi:hypothetical protein